MNTTMNDGVELDAGARRTTEWPANTWPMIRAALFYAELGWPVFPVGHDKRPITEHGHHDATTDEAQINAWWREYPSAGIGLPCGAASNIAVIDIDVKNDAPGMLNAEATGIGDCASYLKSRTPSGGLHLFYPHGELPFRSSAGKAAVGIDLRSSDADGSGSGYVVLPPSLVGGKWYEWAGTDMDALAPFNPSAPIIPDELAIKFCFSAVERKVIAATQEMAQRICSLPRANWLDGYHSERTFSEGAMRLAAGAASRGDLNLDTPYIAKAIDSELDQIAEARRDQNDNLSRRTASIGTILAGLGYTPESPEVRLIEGEIVKAALTMKSLDPSDPWDSHRGRQAINATVAGQMAWGLANPRDLSHVRAGRASDDVQDDDEPVAHIEHVEELKAELATKLSLKNTRVAQLVSMANVKAKKVIWLWHNRFPRSALSVLVGDPAQGKSQTTCDMAARVSTGAPWPDDDSKQRRTPQSVIMLNAEDAAENVIKPRLLAAGADVSKVFTIKSILRYNDKGEPTEGDVSLATDIQTLDDALSKLGDVGLVVIDPISAYLGKVDSHNNSEVRGILAPLARLAEKHNVAIVCVSHLNKGNGGKVTDRVTGSLAFSAAARAVYLVGANPDAEEGDETKIFTAGKTNLAAPIQALSYKIESVLVNGDDGPIDTSRIVWKEALTMSADDLLRGRDDKPDGRSEGRERLSVWLSTFLSDGYWHPTARIEAAARSAGHDRSWRTFERAAKDLGVETRRPTIGEAGAEWRLPKRH